MTDKPFFIQTDGTKAERLFVCPNVDRTLMVTAEEIVRLLQPETAPEPNTSYLLGRIHGLDFLIEHATARLAEANGLIIALSDRVEMLEQITGDVMGHEVDDVSRRNQ